MKNHSSRRANKGQVGYRTPSMFRANKPEKIKRMPEKGLRGLRGLQGLPGQQNWKSF